MELVGPTSLHLEIYFKLGLNLLLEVISVSFRPRGAARGPLSLPLGAARGAAGP